MADILRGYGLAREQAHFKLEQEADVQRHRQRLIREGKLAEEQAKEEGKQQAQQQGEQNLKNSEHNYEMLAEVLQQQARLDDPHALRRRQFERRVKGEPEPLTQAELLRARSRILAVGAAVGHVPRMSMGRSRWQPATAAGNGGGDDLAIAGLRQLTPEAREVAARTYVAGVRALVYGSLLGAVGLAAAGTYAVRSLGITSGEELGQRLKDSLLPMSASIRSWLLPLRQAAESWAKPAAAASGGEQGTELAGTAGHGAGMAEAGSPPSNGGGSGGTSELSKRLQERYNPRKAGQDGTGSVSAGA